MATYKIVQSPTIKDQELPEPKSFNGIDQPFLDTSDFAGDGPWVLKSGDTMFGPLIIKGDDFTDTIDTVLDITRVLDGQIVLLGGTTRLLAGSVISSEETVFKNNDASSIMAELSVESQFPTDGTFAIIDILMRKFGS